MPLGNIVFNQGPAGLGLPLTGQDFVSGLLFYYPVPPAWIPGAPSWSPGGPYVPGDLVYYQGYFYTSNGANTDAVFTPTDWTQGAVYTPYQVGTLVTHNGIVYRCKVTNNDATFTPANWTNLGQNGNLPASWKNNTFVALKNSRDAITTGILPARDANNIYADSNFPDAVAATGNYSPHTLGTEGDTTIITAQILTTNGPVKVTLCNYITTSGDIANGMDVLIQNLVAAINANTHATGFTATGTGVSPHYSTVVITAPKSQGIWVNANGSLSVTLNGISQSSYINGLANGTSSLQAVWYYHIS